MIRHAAAPSSRPRSRAASPSPPLGRPCRRRRRLRRRPSATRTSTSDQPPARGRPRRRAGRPHPAGPRRPRGERRLRLLRRPRGADHLAHPEPAADPRHRRRQRPAMAVRRQRARRGGRARPGRGRGARVPAGAPGPDPAWTWPSSAPARRPSSRTRPSSRSMPPRVMGGIPVRDSVLNAVLNHGNLVLARAAIAGRDGPRPRRAPRSTPPRRQFRSRSTPPRSRRGRGRRRARSTSPGRRRGLRVPPGLGRARQPCVGDMGSWEGLVDAASGELLAFEDRNHYARRVVGRRLPDQQRPAAPGRRRADGLADALRRPLAAAAASPTPTARVACTVAGERTTRARRPVRAHVGRLRPDQRELDPATSTSAAERRHRLRGPGRPLRRRHASSRPDRVLRAEPHRRSRPAATCRPTPGCRPSCRPT